MEETRTPDQDPASAGHEASDADVGGVLAFAGGLLVTLVVVGILVRLLFGWFAGGDGRTGVPQHPMAATRQDRLPPSPRLQTNPRDDLRALRSKEDAVLNSYGWVDRTNGIVRIPIADAMRLAAQRGLPARAER